MSDIDDEIDRLKMRKVEITHKLNMSEFVDEKEDCREELDAIQRQIEILERMK